jgi:hypothetical protein
MIAILPPERYQDWLKASLSESSNFLLAWPSELMEQDQLDSSSWGSSAEADTLCCHWESNKADMFEIGPSPIAVTQAAGSLSGLM